MEIAQSTRAGTFLRRSGLLGEIRASVEVVAAAFEELPFSELLHHPAATAQRLDRVRGLRLRRRDA